MTSPASTFRLPNPDKPEQVYGWMLKTMFVCIQEEVGVNFLIGKPMRIVGPVKENPAAPAAYVLTPFKIHPKDGQFRGIFSSRPPAVIDYDPPTGRVLLNGGIMLTPKALFDDPFMEVMTDE